MDDSRPVTANHVLTALAILGFPAKSLSPPTDRHPTDRHLPLLLGTLLNVVESEIADQVGGSGQVDPGRESMVLDGFLARSDPGTHRARSHRLATLRLNRTAAELHRTIADATPSDRHLVDLAHQAIRCATAILAAHEAVHTATHPATHPAAHPAGLVAAVAGRDDRPDDDDLRTHLAALETAVTDLINRSDTMAATVAELRHQQGTT